MFSRRRLKSRITFGHDKNLICSYLLTAYFHGDRIRLLIVFEFILVSAILKKVVNEISVACYKNVCIIYSQLVGNYRY